MLTDLPMVHGYEVTESGVFRVGRRRVRVSWRAFGVVDARLEDDENVVDVAFDGSSGWRRMTVPRLTVATWRPPSVGRPMAWGCLTRRLRRRRKLLTCQRQQRRSSAHLLRCERKTITAAWPIRPALATWAVAFTK